LEINGSEINTIELMDYWWMSRAFYVGQYDRMIWTSERYSNLHFTVPSVRVYKALDILLSQNRS